MARLTKNEITRMRIKRIEKEIRDTPFHKGTEHHIGRQRAKLSKLKADVADKESRKGGGGTQYAVKKQGDATVVMVGPPSVGKSTLLNALTNAESKVAPYAFTTLIVVPGMMKYKDARIQILDVPGIISGAEKGIGRGREVLSVARAAELLMLITDVEKPDVFDKVRGTLYDNGIRLDVDPPDVVVEKKTKGSIVVHSNIKQDLDLDTIKDVAGEFGYSNCEITIREKLTMDRLIDVFARNRVYVSSIEVVNKVDLKKARKIGAKQDRVLQISAESGYGLDELRESIWDRLDLLRVYLVRREEKPHMNAPIVIGQGSTLSEVASMIGTEFAEGKSKAKIWGTGAKFDGQTVSLKTEAVEGMMVKFV